MSVAIGFLASSLAGNRRQLPVSDRAAAIWAATMDAGARAYCLAGDVSAAEFAIAAGCTLVPDLELAMAQEFDVAWIGAGFLDCVGDEFAGRLAERSAATLLFDVLQCDRSASAAFTVVRDAGRGAREVLEVTGRLVLSISPTAPRPPYVSRFRRQQARMRITSLVEQPEVVPLADWRPVRPRTRRASPPVAGAALDARMDAAFGMSPSQSRHSGPPIEADPRACAQHLLRYLVHHGFLQRSDEAERVFAAEKMFVQSSPVGAVEEDRQARQVANSAELRRPRRKGGRQRAFRGPWLAVNRPVER